MRQEGALILETLDSWSVPCPVRGLELKLRRKTVEEKAFGGQPAHNRTAMARDSKQQGYDLSPLRPFSCFSAKGLVGRRLLWPCHHEDPAPGCRASS